LYDMFFLTKTRRIPSTMMLLYDILFLTDFFSDLLDDAN
jgi:hypothetical protein